MDIACNDLVRQRIMEKIQEKETELKESYINLKKNASGNNSLLDDYEQHYDYIRDEKLKQINVLSNIAEHLDKLVMNTTVLNEQTALLKQDQKIILDKLSGIRYELAEITQ
jgi:hypothetical protein